MKLRAETDAEGFDIELVQDGSRVEARIGDRTYTLEVTEPEPDVFLLKDRGRVYEATVSKGPAARFAVNVKGFEFEVAITDPKRLRGSAAVSEHDSGKAEIKTAMPGKIVRVLRAVGDAVKKGDGIIVVEAMKMQNEMKAPIDGTVAAVRIAEGDTVSAGDILVLIE